MCVCVCVSVGVFSYFVYSPLLECELQSHGLGVVPTYTPSFYYFIFSSYPTGGIDVRVVELRTGAGITWLGQRSHVFICP